MESSLLNQGLELMLVGMGTVFVFLTLLVLATAAMSTLIARLAPVPQAEATTGASDDELAAITAALQEIAGDGHCAAFHDALAEKAAALLAHEVGTHIVTYVNGKAQPFRQLYAGLAGYEAFQEGIAVLAELFEPQIYAGAGPEEAWTPLPPMGLAGRQGSRRPGSDTISEG